ncbi:MAG: toll/interleukin-1 receptor domain-containing protein, partial [Chloroflexi bacterium]|nr:toll/interleukin-1 receptor domain-containing protein [Chloroflexota bacterium]
MADAFISYAREDHDPAARLAAVFEAAGWDVWWDREILAGQSFDEVIERELAAAKVVIVLWSEHSVTSSWVRAEANDALDRGILIPALLTQVTMPLAFRRAQAANLITWQGQPNHDGLESLIL